MRRGLWLGAGTAAVALLAIGGLTLGQRDPTTTPGRAGQARAIDLPRLDGDGRLRLADHLGKPVVVNFFASWCVPCRKELPAFQSVASRRGDAVAFLGIDHQDDREGGLKLLADTGVRYPTGYDPEGNVAREYALFGMPTTLFISPDGRLLETHTGELNEEQLEKALSRHFGLAGP